MPRQQTINKHNNTPSMKTKQRILNSLIPVAAFALLLAASPKASAVIFSKDDIDGDGIPNIVDPDVDNDGIPNRLDDNVDGGIAISGPLRGRWVGDHLRNDDPLEKDIDGDGLRDDALAEKDIDGDGLKDDSILEKDIDGDRRADDAFGERDIDGDERLDNSPDEDDIDGDGINDDLDEDRDGDGRRNDDVGEDDRDGDGVLDDVDDDHGGIAEINDVAALSRTASAPVGSNAKVELSVAGPYIELEIQVEDVPLGTYDVAVGGVVRGGMNVVAVSNGPKGRLKFDPTPDEAGELVLNFSAEGQSVRISKGGVVLFTGTSPVAP